MSDKRSVAIIGLGGGFPHADDVQTYWQNILRGHVAIGEVPPERWDASLWYSADHQAPDKTYCKIGGFIKRIRFDSKQFRIPPASLPAVDDVQKLALIAVAEAL